MSLICAIRDATHDTRDTRVICCDTQEGGPKAVAKPLTKEEEENEEEGSGEEAEKEEEQVCYFHEFEGFVCPHEGEDPKLPMRECYGVKGTWATGEKGTSSNRICEKNGKKSVWYHHSCYVKFYNEHKQKKLKDDEECNYCPACKKPAFARAAPKQRD